MRAALGIWGVLCSHRLDSWGFGYLSKLLFAAQANGKMLPGKKGISLTVEQFDALVAAAPDVSRALESQDLTFSAPLSSRCAAASTVAPASQALLPSLSTSDSLASQRK